MRVRRSSRWQQDLPWRTSPTASIAGDPHIRGAYGGAADFRGRNNSVYNLLSASNTSVNARFAVRTYRTPFSKLNVMGSWIVATYVILRTGTGETMQIVFEELRPHQHSASLVILPPGADHHHSALYTPAARRIKLRHNAPPVVHGGVRIAFTRGRFASIYTLTIRSPLWRIVVVSTAGFPHFGERRMDVSITPVHAVNQATVAPHGAPSPRIRPLALWSAVASTRPSAITTLHA